MRTVPLRRIARILNGGTPTSAENNWGGDIEWATPVDLARTDGRVLGPTDRKLTEIGLATGSTLAPHSAVLLSTRAPIGYTSILATPTSFNQGCKAIVLSSPGDPRFLQFSLISQKESLQAAGSGSTFLELSNEALAEAPVFLFPVEDQRRIADFLDDRVTRIDKIIAARQQQVALADGIITSLLTDRILVGDNKVPLRRFIQDERLGIWGAEPDESEVNVHVARVADFSRDEFKLEDSPTIRSAPHKHIKTRIITPGDVLLERSGGTPMNPVGCPAFVSKLDGPTVCSNFVSRIRPSVDTDGRYLSLAMGALYATRQQEPHSNHTTGIQNLNPSSYFSVSLPKPNLDEQRRIAVEVENEMHDIRRQQKKIKQVVELLQEYKQSLITAAVTGEFDVTTASTRIPE